MMCVKKGKMPTLKLDQAKMRNLATGVGQCVYRMEEEGAKRTRRVAGTVDAEHPAYIGPTWPGDNG